MELMFPVQRFADFTAYTLDMAQIQLAIVLARRADANQRNLRLKNG
jgi:hypothetical protein